MMQNMYLQVSFFLGKTSVHLQVLLLIGGHIDSAPADGIMLVHLAWASFLKRRYDEDNPSIKLSLYINMKKEKKLSTWQVTLTNQAWLE